RPLRSIAPLEPLVETPGAGIAESPTKLGVVICVVALGTLGPGLYRRDGRLGSGAGAELAGDEGQQEYGEGQGKLQFRRHSAHYPCSPPAPGWRKKTANVWQWK